MFIDTNANVSRWPFRRTPCDETDALVDRLKRLNVTQAWTGSLDGLFHRDMGGVNQRLFAECQMHSQLLIPFGSVNPTLPDWEDDLRRCHEDYKMPGIRLHPNFHGYTIDDARLKRLMQLAAERDLIVQLAVRMDDTRVQHHLMQVPDVDIERLPRLIGEIPGLRLMLINALRVVLQPRIGRIVAAGNVHVEISMLEGLGCVGKLLKTMPLERIHFGSHLPLFNIESAILKLRESKLTKEHHAAITWRNAKELRDARNERADRK